MMIRSIVYILLFLGAYLIPRDGISCEGDSKKKDENVENPIAALYLSWADKPESSMIISWITESTQEENSKQQSVSLQLASSEPMVKTTYKAQSKPFPEKNPYLFHSVHIEGLEENSLYLFHIENSSLYHTFRTAPKSLEKGNTVRYVIGGDTYKDEELFLTTNIDAAKTNPLFAVLGGDLAYAAPKSKYENENCQKWMRWLTCWYKTMQAHDVPKGLPTRIIPMIAVIGNHDVKGKYGQTEHEALFFYTLFRNTFSQKSYYTLRFSNYLSLYLLDSNHTAPIDGEQKKWLDEQMKQDLVGEKVLHRIAVYHIPAYPAVRYYSNSESAEIRKHWIPLFDTHHLHLAFENHDHAYKRSFPLTNHHIDPNGVVYIGDGSWGTEPRLPKKASRTAHLEVTKMQRQFCLVTLSQEKREVTSIGPEGAIVDHYEKSVTPTSSPSSPVP